MKPITLSTFIILLGVLLYSCGGSKKFQASTGEDKPLFAAINELNRRLNNEKALYDLKALYSNSIQRHEDQLYAYKNSSDENRFDKMLQELNAMQSIYNAVMATPAATSVVKPRSYQKDIVDMQENAAQYFYDKGQDFLSMNGRDNALMAYQSFQRSNRYINNYKDLRNLIKESYEKSVINVVVTPIDDSRVVFSSFGSWGMDFRYRPEEYQINIVRDLDSRLSSSNRPARFFTDRQAYANRLEADWEVNMGWRSFDGNRSRPNAYDRQVSKTIQIGTDTAGKPVNKTVYATLRIQETVYTVRGAIDYEIRDRQTRQNIDYGSVNDQVEWRDRYATYSGDSRALSESDWAMINNSNNNQNDPTRGDILNELMRKMYPNLRSRIERSFYN